jgi:hypothetical protein
MAEFRRPNAEEIAEIRDILGVVLGLLPREQLRDIVADISFGWHRGQRMENGQVRDIEITAYAQGKHDGFNDALRCATTTTPNPAEDERPTNASADVLSKRKKK